MSAKKKPGEKFARLVVYVPPKLLRWIMKTRGAKNVSARALELLEVGALRE